jgi:hypothetical protein
MECAAIANKTKKMNEYSLFPFLSSNTFSFFKHLFLLQTPFLSSNKTFSSSNKTNFFFKQNKSNLQTKLFLLQTKQISNLIFLN